jgi:transketolase
MEGVSEANVIGMAAGLAMEGKIVYVNTIATFITRRCFEQVVLDVCLHNLNVRLVGNGGGLVYAPLGPTHLAIEDIPMFRAIPNMTIVAPADAEEMRRFMPHTLEHQGPIYIRLAKGGDPIVTPPEKPFKIGKAVLVREGRDILLITTGITLRIALDAIEILKGQGISSTVLHIPTIKPIDREAVLDLADKAKAIVSIEEGVIFGGLGGAVAEVLAEANSSRPIRFKRIGIPDFFPDQYGSQDSLMAHYNISPEAIVSNVRRLLGY